MAFSDNSIIPLLESQVPQFIVQDHPKFLAFIKAYYEWMEDSDQGATLYETKNLLNYKNIDRTTDDFIEYFRKDFLPNFPPDIALDERKLIKSAREFYSKKGSLESIQFLFRVLYDKEIQVFYPKEQVLRASDGRWNLPKSIKVVLSAANDTLDLTLLEKCAGIGSISKAKCRIESVKKYVDSELDKEVVEIYISNLTKQFVGGENIQITYYDSLGVKKVFSEKIIGLISSITVDPKNRGLKYRGTERDVSGIITYPGDPVTIVGGLNAGGIEAVAFVDKVTTGGITTISVLKGGYGFRDHPNTAVSVVNAPGDSGTGANVIVKTLDVANEIYVQVNTDSIANLANVILSSIYAFPNAITANANTILANAFSYANLSFAPLKSLNVISGGTNYISEPSLDFDVLYTTTNNTTQSIRSLGYILSVDIISGGSNYNPAKDKIYFDSTVGYGANATFAVDANGKITSVNVVSMGAGYFDIPSVGVANSSNKLLASNGTGAILVAYGFGDGEELDVGVDDIGRIQSIRLDNRGFDYLSTPNVSLAIQDLKIQPISNTQFFYEADVIYQGANSSVATYIAYVDQYDRANSILRVYNYRGTIDPSANLKTTGFETKIATPYLSTHIKRYGNGKAKATAEFLAGLIKYPGFWSRTDSFLSWDQRLQDSKKYHNFSYEVQVDKALSTYKNALLSILHPAGTVPLGLFTNHNEARPEEIDNLSIYTSNNSLTGNVSSNGTANLTGFGTFFRVSARANDIIVINPTSSDRQFVKVISNVVSNTVLTLESDLIYIANNKLALTNGSNVLVVSTSSTELIANDVITYMNGIASNTAKILNVSGNTLTVNIANSSFTANANNLMYSVNPSINNQSYIIISV
jgi:hypothetical protein